MIVDMKMGADLAEHLAKTLDDLTFELLIRKRISMMFDQANTAIDDLSDSHDYCTFKYSNNDKCEWTVGLGRTYSDAISSKGEVLQITKSNAVSQYIQQNGNRLSLLLPPPDHVILDADTDSGDMKW
jgi:hypothetical protein